jgi:hypothetical protein
MSKGGSQPSVSTTSTQVDPQIKASYLGNVDYARQTANNLGAQQFAGFDPLYQQGESQAIAAANGVGRQQLGMAGQLTGAVAGYSPQQMMAASAGPASMAGAMGYGAATGRASSAGPASMADFSGYNAAQFGGATANMGNIGQYLNPYTQNVIDSSMADLERGRQTAAQQIGERAQAARAFGGSRQGVAEALSNQQFAETAGKTISQLRAQGFDTAANLMQQDLNRQQQAGLSNQTALNQAGQFGAGAFNQASLANQAARNQMAQFNAGQGQQMTLANLAAMNQASQFGAGASNQAGLANQAAMNQMAQFNAQQLQQSGLANQQAGLQGAQFRLGAAQQLGQMGQQQTAADMLAAQSMMGLGGARQQLAQQQMNASRNLGLERLGIMQSALGLQMPGMGTTGTTSTPNYSNPASGALGGALAGYQMFGPYGAIGGGLLGALS